MPYQLSDKLLKQLREAIAQQEPAELYWHYDDSLSPAQINKLLALPDGRNQVEHEIYENNIDEIDRLDTENVREAILPFRDAICLELRWQDHELTDFQLDQIIEEHDLRYSSNGVELNIEQLISMSRPKAVLQLKLFQTHQGYNWRQAITYADVKQALRLFNINPRKIHKSFPNLPYRNGKEYLLPDDLLELWDNAAYGGQYVLPIQLSLSDYLDKQEHYQTGIILHKGSEIWLYDYDLGSGSIVIPLQHDLIIKRKDIPYFFGSDLETAGYGLDQIYGLSDAAWNNKISPLITAHPAKWELPPIENFLKHFSYGNILAAWQQSMFIRAYDTIAYQGEREPGELMEQDIQSNLGKNFSPEAKQFLRTKADKNAAHLIIKVTEQLGQVEITHCELIEDRNQQKIVWSNVQDQMPRSWEVFRYVSHWLQQYHEKHNNKHSITTSLPE